MGDKLDPRLDQTIATWHTDRPVRTGFTLIEFLVVLGIIGLLIAFLLPATRSSRGVARRTQCKHNLKQIALGLLNYESTYQALPPAYTVDALGKPLHSWRTLILPFLDQQALYASIDLSKSWDDPANSVAYQTKLSIYQCPESHCAVNHTTYLASAGSHGCFHQHHPRPMAKITDNRTETLMVIETADEQAVHWMAPTDADEALILRLGAKPDAKLPHQGGMHGALVDGSVRFFDAKLWTESQRLALISIAGNDP